MIRHVSRLAPLALAALCLGCPPGKEQGSAKSSPAPEASPSAEASPAMDAAALREKAKKIFGVLPKEAPAKTGPASPELVDLGRQLYYDPRMSKNHDISCNTCHDLAKYGIDVRGDKTSKGHKGQLGPRNAPTVYNAALQFAQFWDARAKTVEEQATMPVTNPVEMAMADEASVATVLKSIPGYVEEFGKAFPDEKDPVSLTNAGKAIGAFERGLLTPGSPFDQWLEGKDDAMSEAQVHGLQVFMKENCQLCHMGPLLGGSIMQKLGLVEEWPNVTDEGAGGFMFKVPMLRDVTETGPYMHDGSISDLHEMVKMMAKYQLGKDLSDDDANAIVTFLGSLKGNIPTDYIKEPKLPEDGPDTPAPDPN